MVTALLLYHNQKDKHGIGGIFIKEWKKHLLKWAVVLLLLGMIWYTFRDMAEPIFMQLKETNAYVIAAICIASTVYELLEGWVTYGLAKEYQPSFTYRQAAESAFYCSFYRAATLGSGAGIAAVYYFNEKGIAVSEGTGMYMMEYVLHKLSIAIFSILFFLLSFGYMTEHFGEYSFLLLGGYALTIFIALAMVFVCCSGRLHELLLLLADKVNRRHRWDARIEELKKQFSILEDATEFLLKRRKLIGITVLKNMVKLAFWYGIPYVIFYGHCEITMLQTLAVTSLSVMLAAVIPAPAGIGSTEVVFVMLFAVAAGTNLAGAASLLYRFATFVFPFLVGAAIVIARRVRKNCVGAESAAEHRQIHSFTEEAKH